MKKKILLAFMLFIMSISVVACGDKSESIDEKETRQEREKDNDDSDGKSALLGKLSELTGNDVPLTATVPDEDVAVAAVEEVMPAVEEAMPAAEEVMPENTEVDIEIVNPVFFEKEGVTMTFLELSDDYSQMRFRVDNNNPDNKRFDFQMGEVRLNNIGEVDSGYPSAENTDYDEEGLAGTSITYTVDTMLDDYQEFNDSLQIDQEARVINTIVIELETQIGSDSEWEEQTIELKTSKYSEDYNSRCLANCQKATVLNDYTGIGQNIELDSGDRYLYELIEATREYTVRENFNLYYKQVDDGITFIYENGSDRNLMEDGYEYEYINIAVVQGEKIRYYDLEYIEHYGVSKNGGLKCFKFDKTASDIKKELEISNDTPISILILHPNKVIDEENPDLTWGYYNEIYAFLCPLE